MHSYVHIYVRAFFVDNAGSVNKIRFSHRNHDTTVPCLHSRQGLTALGATEQS